MASSSASLHEDEGKLNPKTIDQHRAYVSLQEELEAADWYNQRVEGATDPELAAILAHNRDEEKEHAAMVLEWLRRGDPKLDEHLRTYLFTEGSILDIEVAAEHGGGEETGSGDSGGGSTPADSSLGIGSLRGTGSLIVTGA
ncbi:encapsulin-associated ferritin-like protein [Dongia sedimenti]|uniref:Ferritin-like domain-containing protein n=1 Tax=Dongia sedimenti TaxID=3064282 RepID=A0ABU0YVI9_9PROT|nr:ferritin-like domain-containing protein [Rhodospirillaceae bacterium R-7]